MIYTSGKFAKPLLAAVLVGTMVLAWASVALLQGLQFPSTAELSDQKIGSVLVYNLYTSSATNSITQNTDISITNTNTTTSVSVHLFFVNSNNSRAADTFISLAPRQTMSFLASDFDPGITGYLVAVAVNAFTGCPLSFNHLMGDAYVKFATGHNASLGAQAFAALYTGTLPGCDANSTTAALDFNGVTYNRLPRVLAANNIPARADGNDTLLVVNRIGGNFVQGSGAATLGSLFGLLYDDDVNIIGVNSASFTFTGGSQLRLSLSNTFPRTTPRFETHIPAGHSGWMKFWSPSDIGIVGAVLNFNPNAAAQSNAFTGGYNLHGLTLSANNTLTIPVSPPNGMVDLTVGIAHNGFNIGTPGTYTVTVTNLGTKLATGTITVFDTLPNNLTLAGASGTGWSCTGTDTANVACSNTSGLAAMTSLPPLVLTVNVGAGTPASISNTVIVANAGDGNPANDAATDNATVTSRTVTTTTLASSLNPSNVGQAVTFTATVAGAGGTPTGTVQFFDGTTLLGSISLTGGTAMLMTSALTLGVHSITAVYNGNATFANSTSAALDQTVMLAVKNATTTTLTSSVNPSLLGQSTTFTATVTSGVGLPTGSVEFFDGGVSLGTRTLSGAGIATLSVAGLLAGTHTITAQYLGDTSFATSASPPVSQVVNQVDQGSAYPATAENSDQKIGSVLVYNLYSSLVATPSIENTDISLTNTNATTGVTVHLFMVRGDTGKAADTFVTLPANQTVSLLASNFDPGVKGYIVAVAVDAATGCPIGFNFLAGDVDIKLASGHFASLSAQAFSALYSGNVAGCVAGSTSATLNFNGTTGYNLLPRVLEANSFGSLSDGNSTLLTINRPGGSFLFNANATAIGSLSGTLSDDVTNAVNAYPWSAAPATTQFSSVLSDSFPLTNPVFSTAIPMGHRGWLKFFSSNLITGGLLGSILQFNPNASTQAKAFNGGQNLHELTLADPIALIVPVFPSTFAANLAITKTHSGSFTTGLTGTYNITVSNIAGAKSAHGTIRVTDTLPGNLTLASFSGTGWSCTGAGTANAVCTNTNGLAAGAALPALTLTVNVGAGTPLGTNSITNSATVALFPPQETNTGNNTANDPTTILFGCTPLTVNPTTIPVGTAGAAYSQTFTQTGGSGAITWSNPGGGLPGGLTLNTSTGVLSGTPTAQGTFNFTMRATDVNQCTGERAYSLVINQMNCPTITVNPSNPTLTAGTVGTAYTQPFTQTGGAGAIVWSVSAGTLPGGLTLNTGSGVLSGTPTTAGASTFTIRATDFNQCTGERQYTLTINAAGGGLQFFPLPQPVRLLETRPGFTGCTMPGVPINANGTLTLPARTTCAGIPANAAAVTGNITVVPSGPGFLTLFPSSATQPTVANSNFQTNEITNNVFTVGLGATDGAFKIFSSALTHVIVDVTGYYAPPNTGGLYFHALATPVRLLETRPGFTGCIAPGVPLTGTGNPNADPNLDLLLQGRSPVAAPCNSIPATAQVLVGNATSVLPNGGGYLTIYPSGGTRPTVASSNYAGGDVINGPFAVKLGADGKFKIYTFATTHLVVDILGYYSEDAVDANGAGLLFNPLPSPVRLLETRPGFAGCTMSGAPIVGNLNAATHTQMAANFCGLPASAQAVVGNVSVVNTTGAGFLTLFPANLTTAPLVATSNYPAPATFGYNRHFFVGLSPADGKFKVLTQFTTDLILDASGYFAP